MQRIFSYLQRIFEPLFMYGYFHFCTIMVEFIMITKGADHTKHEHQRQQVNPHRTRQDIV